jgi:nitric oxide reductase subunit C
MDNEKAARLGKGLFFIGSGACLLSMFAYLTPVTLAYINESNHLENGKAVPADVVRGKQAFHKFSCMDCHTILGDGTQYAPELGRAAIIRDDAFLEAYVKDAAGINPASGMPSFKHMSDQEAQDLVAFLNFTSKVNLPEALWAEMKANHDPYDPRAYDLKTNRFAQSYWPPRPMSADKKAAAPTTTSADPLVAEGAKLFHQNKVASCNTCHKIGGEGGAIGPDLTTVGSSAYKTRFGAAVSPAYLESKLTNPAVDNPAKNSAMPSYEGLSADQRKALVAYLLSLKN